MGKVVNLPETSVLAGRFFINLQEVVKDDTWWKDFNGKTSSTDDGGTEAETTTAESSNGATPDSSSDTETKDLEEKPKDRSDSRTAQNESKATQVQNTDDQSPGDNADNETSNDQGWIFRTIGNEFLGGLKRLSKNGENKIQISSFPSSASKLIQLDPLSRFRSEFEEIPDSAEDTAFYVVIIKTRDVLYAGTENNVEMKIIGLRGETEKFRIQEGPFLRGSRNQFTFRKKNVGRVIGAEFEIKNSDEWNVKSVEITTTQFPNDEAVFGGFSLSTGDSVNNVHTTEILQKLGPPKFQPLLESDFEEEFAADFRRFVDSGRSKKRLQSVAEKKAARLNVDIPIAQKLIEVYESRDRFQKIVYETSPETEKEIETLEKALSEDKLGQLKEYFDSTAGKEILDQLKIKVSFDTDEKQRETFIEAWQGLKILIQSLQDNLLIPRRAEIFSIVYGVISEINADILRLNSVTNATPNVETFRTTLENKLTAFDLSVSGVLDKAMVDTFIDGIRKTFEEAEPFVFEEVFPEKDRTQRKKFLASKERDLEALFEELKELQNINSKAATEAYKMKLEKVQENVAREIRNTEGLLAFDSSPDASFSSFLRGKLQLKAVEMVNQVGDNIGFFGKLEDSSAFDFSFDQFNFVERGSILPSFGLMVRSDLDPSAQFFGLLFVPRAIPAEYSICTFVRQNIGDTPTLTGSLDIGDASDFSEYKLKVTRRGNIFKGFFNGGLVGEALLNMTQKSAKARSIAESSRNLSAQTLKKDVYTGIAWYAVPKFVVKTSILPDPLSCVLQFSGIPRFADLYSEDADTRSFAIVEYYKLSMFDGVYEGGRILNTFTLLPGEETDIFIKTFKETSTSSENTKTVFEEITDDTARELEESVEAEQSNESQFEKNMNFHTEASGGYSGWGATANVSVGFEMSNNSARQQMAKSLTSALEKNANKASSKRSVEVNTTQKVEEIVGTSTSVTRRLRNINNNKTLDYIFRQMNQEYISVLHLVDIKVAYIGGGDGTYAETSLTNLETFLKNYITDEPSKKQDDEGQTSRIKTIRDDIFERAKYVVDYQGDVAEVLEKLTLKFGNNARDFTRFKEQASFLKRRNKSGDYEETNIRVPGYIIAYDTNVIRTDAVVTEARLGEGNALDDFGLDLERTDIEAKEASTGLTNAKKGLLDVQRKAVQQYIDGIQNFEEILDTVKNNALDKDAILPDWIQKRTGRKEYALAINNVLEKGLEGIDDDEKYYFERGIRKLVEWEGYPIEEIEKRTKLEKEKIPLFNGIGSLLGGLNFGSSEDDD
mmetsp:Transcript_17224/g.39806  ORF Transcript_17224/g.39806 Transcript_17224/m.39806 type:complete len:1287 (+) Transcript_17224:159-4019(+)|eukprot:CAMPEP_0197194914 /NCGR_PEP_ID=MMETSP1423-20130617/30116_1 /TAXON_ID=476441 /ORGANISM="Pseudo-nitzschia heimii, Strain UNC1101" /LENGTH=1286 /DNA_ID=CAMNT_0042648423 /DNA_START=97 /DNA_END=3957 /DNA_ORIENTATION=+